MSPGLILCVTILSAVGCAPPSPRPPVRVARPQVCASGTPRERPRPSTIPDGPLGERVPTLRGRSRSSCCYSAALVRRVVAPALARARRCYEAALERDARLEGHVLVQFTLDPAGYVDEACEGPGDAVEAELVACVVKAFADLDGFPEAGECGPRTIQFPIDFHREGGAG